MAKTVTTKPATARTPRQPRASKNSNLGTFVDAITPEPKIVQEDFLQMDVLGDYLKKASAEQKEWISQMMEITLSINKQEEFLSLGEKVAINTLRKMKILV
jgi:hypothetical protein